MSGKRCLGAVSWLWLAIAACTSSEPGTSQSQTHWLAHCDRDRDCGGLSCMCGRCAAPCSASGSCRVAGLATECQSRTSEAAVALCDGSAPEPVCLEPCDGECARGQRCVGGACLPAVEDGDGGGDAQIGDDGGDTAGTGGTGGGGTAGDSGVGDGGETDAGRMDGGAENDASMPGTDAATAEVACNVGPIVFPSFDRSCSVPEDCTLGWRVISCCGTQMANGIRASESEAFNAAAQLCASQFPACGCAPGPIQADDGSTADDGTLATAAVDCVSGQCRSSLIELAGTTPCGPSLQCNAASEICVAREPVGPAIIYDCQPVPGPCQLSRTCSCVAPTFCMDGFNQCSDDGNNAVTCHCPMCQ